MIKPCTAVRAGAVATAAVTHPSPDNVAPRHASA